MQYLCPQCHTVSEVITEDEKKAECRCPERECKVIRFSVHKQLGFGYRIEEAA